jgi:hypothetical protein
MLEKVPMDPILIQLNIEHNLTCNFLNAVFNMTSHVCSTVTSRGLICLGVHQFLCNVIPFIPLSHLFSEIHNISVFVVIRHQANLQLQVPNISLSSLPFNVKAYQYCLYFSMFLLIQLFFYTGATYQMK